MPPVVVANPPDSTWEHGGVIASFAAMIIAIFTLMGVGYQIFIANRTLDKTTEELALTRQSNEFIKQDLEYSRTQATFVSQKARLSLHHDRRRINHVVSFVDKDKSSVNLEIRLWLFNDGDRTARDATMFLWLPWPDWKVPEWDGKVRPDVFFTAQGLKTIANVEVDGKRYWHVSVDLGFPTYPGVERMAHSFIALVPVPYEGDMLWRIGYDDGIEPPADAPPARMRFRVKHSE